MTWGGVGGGGGCQGGRSPPEAAQLWAMTAEIVVEPWCPWPLGTARTMIWYFSLFLWFISGLKFSIVNLQKNYVCSNCACVFVWDCVCVRVCIHITYLSHERVPQLFSAQSTEWISVGLNWAGWESTSVKASANLQRYPAQLAASSTGQDLKAPNKTEKILSSHDCGAFEGLYQTTGRWTAFGVKQIACSMLKFLKTKGLEWI